jgi:hypothetical protein
MRLQFATRCHFYLVICVLALRIAGQEFAGQRGNLLAGEPAAHPKKVAKERAKRSSSHLRLFVPAYFYPAGEGGKDWDRLLAAADRVPIVAVVNPASGPGRAADPNYVKLLERARKTKIMLLGYVTTTYAKRPLADVKADVDQWLRLYSGLHGIFCDEQASAAKHLDYYLALRDYVRSKWGLTLVVSNPGAICDEGYFSREAADAICLFEGPKTVETAELPDWTSKYSPDRLLVLSYKVPAAEAMRKCIRSTSKQAGCIYVTDAGGANPWDRLPTYWNDEVALVEETNRASEKPSAK